MGRAAEARAISPSATPSSPFLRAVPCAPLWLEAMWGKYLSGASIACPSCAPRRAISLGLAVCAEHRAYRLQCAGCAWRTPWFEAPPSGRLLVVMIDVP
jgi:hypothetical protein